MTDQNVQTIVVKDTRSSAVGLSSFIMGIISIFFLSVVFVPLAILLSIIGIIKGQFLWSILGLIMAIIGFFTSPVLLGLVGLATLGAVS